MLFVQMLKHLLSMSLTNKIPFCNLIMKSSLISWVRQVSVAALLDNFISASSEMEMEEKLRKAQAFMRDRLELNPMEPLLIKLAREFTDSRDLSDRLLKLYKVSCPTSVLETHARVGMNRCARVSMHRRRGRHDWI